MASSISSLFLASFVYTVAYRSNCGRYCSILSIIGFLLYTAYNYGMSAMMALYIAPLGIIFILSTIFVKSQKILKLTALIYIIGSWAVLSIQYSNWFDIFPIIATTLSTLSLLMQNCSVKRKALGGLSSFTWVIYGLQLNAIGMIATCTVFGLSTFQSMVKDNIGYGRFRAMLMHPWRRQYETRPSGAPATH